jgi:hypothetical protein
MNTQPTNANDEFLISLSSRTAGPMYADVPDSLKKLPNWAVWRLEKRNGSSTKVPYSVNGGFAKSNDPSTWTTFESAVAVADDPLAFRDGIGFMLQGTNLVGLDFDGVRQDGVVDPYVLEIIKELGSPYTEITPSTTGLRMFVECAQLPKGNRKFSAKSSSVKKYGAEIYSGGEGGRYLTATGGRFSGEGVPNLNAADIELPYLLISQFPNEKFKKLWMGDASDYENDESRGDLALCNILLKLLGPDKEKIDQYFRKSKLCDEKWLNRAEYREWTIAKAMNGAQPAPPPEQAAASASTRRDKTERLRQKVAELEFHHEAVDYGEYEYVVDVIRKNDYDFDGWFPLGRPSLIGGSSGSGKSTFMFDLLVKQFVRAPVFGRATHGRPYVVLMLDRGKKAHKATMRRMNLVTDSVPIKFLNPVLDRAAAQEIINRIEECDPLPLIVFIEGLDMLTRDASEMKVVTPFMHDVQKIAEHFDIALIGSMGAPKTKANEGYTAKRDQLFGSAVWSRMIETIVAVQYPGGKDTADQREFTVMLRNGKPESLLLEFQHGVLVHVPEAEQPTADKKLGPKLQKAVNFIRKVLQDGPMLRDKLMENAKNRESITESTLLAPAAHLQEYEGLMREPTGKGGAWQWWFAEIHATKETLKSTEENEAVLDREFDLS